MLFLLDRILRAGGREVEFEHILMDDRDAVRWKPVSQDGDELAIQLDSQHAAGTRSQSAGYGTAPRADLDHRPAADIAQRGHDAVRGALVGEKVLAEPGFALHGCTDGSGWGKLVSGTPLSAAARV